MYAVYRSFRPSVPEKLFLNTPFLIFDSGIPPLESDLRSGSRKKSYKSLFFKRKRIEFSPLEFETMKLRETNSGNRLTIDKGNDRIDIAKNVTEIDREWLFNYLKSYYS